MINVYAVNFTDENGTFQNEWTLIQTIPVQNRDDITLVNPSVTLKIDTAETMSFSVYADTKYYNAFNQLTTYIRVDYDGQTIFYGRILTIDTGYYGERKIQCEGAIAFLNDTYYEGRKESERPVISLAEYLQKIIDNHNAHTGDDYKKIYLGEVPGNYSNSISDEQKVSAENRRFGESSWSTSKSALENLKSHHGGYFRTRYSGGRIYLDWIKHYNSATTIDQTVSIGKNVIDLTYITEVNNIFTAIIPFGKTKDTSITINGYREDIHGSNNYLRVDDITQIYSDNELNSGYHRATDYHNAVSNYGLIFKTVEFEEATTQASLFTKAAAWIKDNYFGGIDSFTVSAVDMHQVGENEQQISIGDRVNVQYVDDTTVSRVLTCTSVKFDLYNPEKNQYSFGIPSTSLNKNYSVNSTKSSSTSSYSASYKYPDSTEVDQEEVWLNGVLSWFQQHKVWKKSNGGVEGGPNATAMMNYFLRPSPEMDENGNSKWFIWYPVVQSKANGIITWGRDGQGHPRGAWLTRKKEDVNTEYIVTYHLLDYVKEEYSIDLRSKDSDPLIKIDMPNYYTSGSIGDIAGKIVNFVNLANSSSSSSLVQKILSFGKDSIKLFSNAGTEGETLTAFIDENGDYHYYKKNQDGTVKTDDQGNPIEISVNSIDEDVVTIHSQLSADELVLASHGVSITKIGSDVTIIGGDLTEAQAELAAQGQQILVINNDLTQFQSQTETQISTLTTSVDGMSSTITNIDGRTSTLENTVDGMSSTVTGLNGQVSTLTNTVNGLSSTVTSLDGQVSTLSNTVDGFEAKLEGVVDENGNVTAASIATAINDQGQAGVKISGSWVNINASQVKVGSTSNVEAWMDETDDTLEEQAGLIADCATIAQLNVQKARIDTISADYIKASELAADIADIDTVNVFNLDANGYIYGTTIESAGGVAGADIGFVESGAQAPWSLKNFIKELQIVPGANNTYTLQKKSYNDSNWQDVGSFSRAVTSLDGSWSNGVYKVTPTGANTPKKEIGFASGIDVPLGIQTNGTPTSYSSNDKYIVAPLKVVEEQPNQSPVTRHTLDLTINATAAWNAGNTSGTYAGKYSVTLANPTWSSYSGNVPANRTVTVSTSGRTNTSGTTANLSSDIALYLTQGSWSSNKLIVYMRQGSASGTVRAQTEVDASDIYSNGVTNGKNAVTITKGSWLNGRITFSKSEGTASTKGVVLSNPGGSWSSGTYTTTLNDVYDANNPVSTGYSVSVSLPSISLFDTTHAPTDITVSGHTNNSDGYQIGTTGSNGTAYIVTKGTITEGGSTRYAYSYLGASPTALYRKAYGDGYSAGLPSDIAIGDGWRTDSVSDSTLVSWLSTSSFWSANAFNNNYGYAKFGVSTHGKTKYFYFSFDNRKLSSGGNPAYGEGYSAGVTYGEVVTDFGAQAPSGETYGSYTNNSNGYYQISTGSSGEVVIVVRGRIRTHNSTTDQYLTDYLKAAPTAIYRKGISDGEIVTYFDVASPSGQSYSTYTNNSDGYYQISTGASGEVAIVVKGIIGTHNSSTNQNKTSYLRGAPTAVYRKGYSDGRSSAGSYTDKGSNWSCSITQLTSGGKKCSLVKEFAAGASIPFTNGSSYHLYTS